MKQAPLLVILGVLLVVWYAAAVVLNREAAQRTAGTQQLAGLDLVSQAWQVDRPVLPAPHQVIQEIWNTTAMKAVTSRRSLLHHAWITLLPAVLGFLLGILFGGVLAAGIVLHRGFERSLMPWIITSQCVPILALAPMIVVVLASVNLTGLLPKALISMYLSFFPIIVGMVKGLRSADPLLHDLMRSYSAGPQTVFSKLRMPAAVSYLFASMKVAMAAALVGAIVGELPTGSHGGLGARMLAASYYGQTIQIWSALVMAATLGALLVGAIGVLERVVVDRMQIAR